MATERPREGFTLVELLVVIAIMALLVGLLGFTHGPSASDEQSYLDASLAAVQILPGLARQKGVTLTLQAQNQRLLTYSSAGVVEDGPSVPIPQDASAQSDLQVSPNSVSGSLILHVSNTCTRITPLLYGSAAPVRC
ncbi:prepilin-type N-terminal cleavage/methylation domain-containing protein [Deinococcus ruber]|uniref:Uncharacterized protein n=1 Tax=Deinococcus ruber TaxID=1848197 RepID=A0A918C8F6_9DEIO|nr:prepilin-type N-terminal cleavage/methylation domain-containing protein [Deinococcus ruber]GGR10004.1 hypothetical protein GCM10008957_23480 [Deinococcus ruber]